MHYDFVNDMLFLCMLGPDFNFLSLVQSSLKAGRCGYIEL